MTDVQVNVLGSAPRWLVVALHGYGSCGEAIATALVAGFAGPSVLVFAPDGGEPATLVTGRAWYPLTSRLEEMRARSRKVATALERRIDSVQCAHGIPPERTAVVGFSQGGTVAAVLLEKGRICRRGVLLCSRVPRCADGHDARRARQARLPLLVVTGGRDYFAPSETVQSDLKASVVHSHAHLVTVPDLGHEVRSDIAVLAMAFATGCEPVYDAGRQFATTVQRAWRNR